MLNDKCKRALERGQSTAMVRCEWERGSLGVISLTASLGMQKAVGFLLNKQETAKVLVNHL